MKRASDIKVGSAGCVGTFSACALAAEIPAFLREGALEALGAQLDCEGDALSLMRHGAWATLRVNATGHYILSVVEHSKRPPCLDRRPNLAASYFEWSSSEKRQDLFRGRLRRNGIRRSWVACFFVSRPPKNFRLVRQ